MDISHGKKIFQFDNFDDWINTAQAKYGSINLIEPTKHTIAVDQWGRICYIGKHFNIAKKEDSFPIEVFAIREDENNLF